MSEVLRFPGDDTGGSRGFFVIRDGVLIHVDSVFCEAMGRQGPGRWIGVCLRDILHPEDEKYVRMELSGRENQVCVNPPLFRILDENRKNVWVYLAGRHVTWNNRPGNHIGYLVYGTPFGSVLKALEDSLERYETILNDADIHLGELDLEGKMTFINDAGCRMWGLPRKKLLGLPSRAYMDDEMRQAMTEIYRRVYQTAVPEKNIVLDVKDLQGSRRTIEKSVSLIRDDSGTVTGFRNVTRDITERKDAERKLAEHRSRLEAIFESVKDAIITVDSDFVVIDANRSTEAICGLSVSQITGIQLSACPGHCGRACHEVLRQTLKNKEPVREHRIECDHSSRPQQVASVSCSPLIDPQGNFLGAVMVIRDITLLRDVERELRERNQFQNLIGRNKTMQNIYRLLEDLANLDTTVLVTGESGTGKELVARALHYSGNRAFKPFITVNCSALSESLLESELFGHVQGAFTGAIRDKKGRFAVADGGTILLDEIGDISPMIQLKLLRVLQEKEFDRVGDSTPQKVDVRVIACTNRDLKEKAARGEFRQDLYYRLKVVEVALPPLRERLEDLPLLTDHFRRMFNERFSRNIEGISSKVLSLFMDYSWPGNVRELEHVMEHAFVLCHGGTITLKHLPGDIRNHKPVKIRSDSLSHRNFPGPDEILAALRQTDWNKAKAARILGIGRRTIYRKMETYRIYDQS